MQRLACLFSSTQFDGILCMTYALLGPICWNVSTLSHAFDFALSDWFHFVRLDPNVGVIKRIR